jgi:hypothetical protein
MKRLKKLIKKILIEEKSKESKGEGVRIQENLHLYSGCTGLQGVNGSGTGASFDIINQMVNPNAYSGTYAFDLQGPSAQGSSAFNLAEVLNNNNVIHNLWLTPSIGQIIKMYTCPPSATTCSPTCLKYEGPVGIYEITSAPNLQDLNALDTIQAAGYDMYTFGYASNLGLTITDDNPYGYGVIGTYNSCDECGGLEPPPQGYNCRRSDAGDNCVPCPQSLFPDGGGVPGCMFTSLENCEAAWGSESCKAEEDTPLGDLEEPKSLTTMAQTLQKRAGITPDIK